MPGVYYVNKNSSTISLTSAILFDCPNEYKKVLIRTGTDVNATIGFGLTTDSTASEYSPAIMYTNNTVCYLGTYSTGSSSYSGTYKYTITSGYDRIQTGATALTERRTGDGQISYQQSGTEQYIASTNSTSYYSGRTVYTMRTTAYGNSGYNRVEGAFASVPNPSYNRINHTYPKGNSTAMTTQVATGQYAASGYTSNSAGNSRMGVGNFCFSEVTANPMSGTYNYYTYKEYITTYYGTTVVYSTYIGGKVTKSSPVYSTSTTYTTLYSTTHGVYTVTTGWKYGYSSRYTERTSTSSNADGQSWTSSNINVF